MTTPEPFHKNYTVLKTDLSKEESIYILVKNATDIFFHIFPSKYPGAPNYKLDPTKLQIQGCRDDNICEELMECQRAVPVTCWKPFKF
jgi:hypothetical protein